MPQRNPARHAATQSSAFIPQRNVARRVSGFAHCIIARDMCGAMCECDARNSSHPNDDLIVSLCRMVNLPQLHVW